MSQLHLKKHEHGILLLSRSAIYFELAEPELPLTYFGTLRFKKLAVGYSEEYSAPKCEEFLEWPRSLMTAHLV
jgi:hypothetical protein